MLATIAARPMSATTISRRRHRTRSSQTPAGNENSRCGQDPDRGQGPHLRGVRAERQDGDERQPELGDLVAEDRDGLADPQPAKVRGVDQQGAG